MRFIQSALLLAALASPMAASAADGSFAVSTTPTFTVRVDGVSASTGWGAHFSTRTAEDGYGGSKVECYLRPDGASSLTAECFDGYNAATSSYQNQYEVPLGARSEIDFVTFNVSNRGVEVTAQRVAVNATSAEEVPYIVRAYLPLRESTGFYVSGSTVYYQANGVLSGHASRTGTGFTMSVVAP